MSNFLHDLALAHQHHEGYYYNTIAYRLNNPGNLRGMGGAFIHFPTYQAGFNALKGDLYVKIVGTAKSIQRYIKSSGKTYEQLTFQDYVAIYAPSADSNNPVAYCDALCRNLSNYKVTPSTPLWILAKLIRGEIEQVPDPPSPPMDLEKRLDAARNALRWADPERKSMLLRLIERLTQAITHQSF